MSNFCKSCGISIPEKQKFCSMCYGDPEYGTDGYYKNMIEQDMLKQAEKERQQENEESDGIN